MADEKLPPDPRLADRRGDSGRAPVENPSDRALLETPTGRIDEGGLFDEGDTLPDDAWAMDVGGHPKSEETADSGPDSGKEIDGLDETEENVRAEAEDRPLGAREDSRG